MNIFKINEIYVTYQIFRRKNESIAWKRSKMNYELWCELDKNDEIEHGRLTTWKLDHNDQIRNMDEILLFQ
jgi:hypothetical protein